MAGSVSGESHGFASHIIIIPWLSLCCLGLKFIAKLKLMGYQKEQVGFHSYVHILMMDPRIVLFFVVVMCKQLLVVYMLSSPFKFQCVVLCSCFLFYVAMR